MANPQIWIDALLQDRITPEDKKALEDWLKASPENQAAFHSQVAVEKWLRALAVEDVPNAAIIEGLRQHFGEADRSGRRRKLLRLRRFWPALAAAAAVVVAVGLWWTGAGRDGVSLARVEVAEGHVTGHWSLVSGEKQSKALNVGDEVSDGMRIETGPGAKLVLVYAGEDTAVELFASSQLSVSVRVPSVSKGKRLHLQRGKLVASVTPQPQDKPMTITTPHSRTTVLGTRLSVSALAALTRVEVHEGLVECRRLSDGESVRVAKAQFVEIGEGLDLEVKTLSGTGEACFTPVPGSPFAVGNNPVGLALGDVNGDGHTDIVTANEADETFTILLGDGTGGFVRSPASAVPAGAFRTELKTKSSSEQTYVRQETSRRHVYLSDLDGDNDLDLVTGDRRGVVMLLNDGTGVFRPAPSSPLPIGDVIVPNKGKRILRPGPRCVSVADVNSDGWPDIIVSSGDHVLGISTTPSLFVLLNDRAGGFTPAKGSPFEGTGRCPTVGDFNGDGNLDVAQLQRPVMIIIAGLSIMAGNGTGGFATEPVARIGTHCFTSLAAGDFNGDGWKDIVLHNREPRNGPYILMLRLADGKGETIARRGPLRERTGAVNVGDVNGDGLSDVVVLDTKYRFRKDAPKTRIEKDHSSGGLCVYLGGKTGGLTEVPGSPFRLWTDHTFAWHRMKIGDIDGDGKDDIVVAHRRSDEANVPDYCNKVSVLRSSTP